MAGPNWLKLFERTPGYPGPVTLAKKMSSKFDFFFQNSNFFAPCTIAASVPIIMRIE